MALFDFTEANLRQQATDDDIEWKCQFDAWTSRLRARQVALKAAAAGPAPYLMLVYVGLMCGFGGQFGHAATEFVVCFSTTVLAGAYIVLVGVGSAWVAHRFAYGTAVPVERLARCLVWVANLSLWGWGLVDVLSKQ